jgi:hypothetical protein
VPEGYNQPIFGFPVTTFCSSTPQLNEYAASWADFFGENRLRSITKIIEETKGLDKELRALIDITLVGILAPILVLGLAWVLGLALLARSVWALPMGLRFDLIGWVRTVPSVLVIPTIWRAQLVGIAARVGDRGRRLSGASRVPVGSWHELWSLELRG